MQGNKVIGQDGVFARLRPEINCGGHYSVDGKLQVDGRTWNGCPSKIGQSGPPLAEGRF